MTESQITPLECVDACIGKRIWVIMKTQRELDGVLSGMDEFVNLVLSDVNEYEVLADGSVKKTHVESVLLNGNNVAMLVPGKSRPSAD
jgi:U6 snRNA-associated Sm-like protein LSm5